MAVCDYCHQDMLSADGCTNAAICIDGESHLPIRYGSEPGSRRTKRRCGDCNVLPGEVHHHGCDIERCPACEGQAIWCDCLWAGEEHLAEHWADEMEECFQLIGPDE